jgi:hypothetical protein
MCVIWIIHMLRVRFLSIEMNKTYRLGNWKSIRYKDAGTEYKRKNQVLDTAYN